MNSSPSSSSESRALTKVSSAVRAWDMSERSAQVTEKLMRSRLGKWWLSTTKPSVVDWLLLGAVLFIAYTIFLYGDIRATYEHSFNFLDALFSGRLKDFYQISIENTSTGHPAVYDVPLYALFALWNLPTYIIHQLTGFDFMLSTPAQLWLKTMVVVAALLSAKILMSLAQELGVSKERSKWVAFFFMSSMSVFVPVFIIVQYDIILVLCILMGLRSYVQGNLPRFIAWFFIANTLKLFAVFIFIPLLLLREKRIRHFILQLFIGSLGIILSRLFYRGNVAYEAATGGFLEGMLRRLIATGIPWQNSSFSTQQLVMPLFVIFMIGIAVWAYVKKTSSQQELGVVAIYSCLAVYLVFVALVPLNPYWIVLLAPFSVLIIFLNPEYLMLNTIIETTVSTAVLVLYILVGFPIYNRDIFTQLLLPHFISAPESPRFYSPNEILTGLSLHRGASFVVALIIAGVLATLILNYPRSSMIAAGRNDERMPRSAVWFRMVPMTGFATLVLMPYFIPAVATAYSSETDASEPSSVNILDPDAVITEQLVFDSDIQSRTLEIGFLAGQVQWIDSSVVHVEITDDGGAVIFRESLPANSLGDKIVSLDTNGLTFDAGKTYTMRITSDLTEGGIAHLQINPMMNRFVTVENGREVDGDLVLRVTRQ